MAPGKVRLIISLDAPISDDRGHTTAAWKRSEPEPVPLARVFVRKRALH